MKTLTWINTILLCAVLLALAFLVIALIIGCWVVYRYEPIPDGVHELEAELEANDYGWSDTDPIIFGTWKSNERWEFNAELEQYEFTYQEK
ncbi:hypothetical protein ES703_81580 [subsurface metagenome]